MWANFNAITGSFFLLILPEKKRVGQHQFFQTYMIEMLNFRKTMQFFLGAKSQSSTCHIWEFGKLYTMLLLGTCRFSFNFDIVSHAKTADFLSTR